MHEIVRQRPTPVLHGRSDHNIAKKMTEKANHMIVMMTSRPEMPQSSGSKPTPQRNIGGSIGASSLCHDADVGLSSSCWHGGHPRAMPGARIATSSGLEMIEASLHDSAAVTCASQ